MGKKELTGLYVDKEGVTPDNMQAKMKEARHSVKTPRQAATSAAEKLKQSDKVPFITCCLFVYLFESQSPSLILNHPDKAALLR